MTKITSQNNISYSRSLLGKARHLLVGARRKELAPYQISPMQAKVLALIYDLGDRANFTNLVELTERNANTLSILISRMENDGLVKKIRKTQKSNQLRFELTEKGLNLYKVVKKIKSTKAIMSALSEEELKQLSSLLEKIVIKAKKYKN